MRVTLHGDATGSAVAMLSTWDPMLVTQHAGLADLRAHAAARGLTPLALALDPAPALLLNGPARWPVHSDVNARVARLRACGVTVGVVHFERDDLGAGRLERLAVVRVTRRRHRGVRRGARPTWRSRGRPRRARHATSGA